MRDVALIQVVEHSSFRDGIEKTDVRQLKRRGIALQLSLVISVPDQQEPHARAGQELRGLENRLDLVPASVRADVGADEVAGSVERILGRYRRTHVEHPVVHAVGDEQHVSRVLPFGDHSGADAFGQRNRP